MVPVVPVVMVVMVLKLVVMAAMAAQVAQARAVTAVMVVPAFGAPVLAAPVVLDKGMELVVRAEFLAFLLHMGLELQ